MAAVTTVRIGRGVGLIGESTLAVLDSVNANLADRLWRLVLDGAGIDEMLEELSATGLRSLGSLAMVQIEDGSIRVVVRGSAVVAVTTAEGCQVFTGQDVRTWTEAVVSTPHDVELRLDGDDGGASPFVATVGLLPAIALRRSTQRNAVELTTGAVDSVEAPDPGEVLTGPPLPTPEPPPADHPQASASPDLSATRTVEEHIADSTTDGDAQPLVDSQPKGDEQTSQHPPATDSPTENTTDYLSMWGHTVARTVQDAAMSLAEDGSMRSASSDVPRTASGPSDLIEAVPGLAGGPTTGAGPASLEGQLGDHDGKTMTKAQLQALRSGASAIGSSASAGGPQVQALVCVAGHANPPDRASCKSCGAALGQSVVVIARPSLGTLRFANHTTVSLDRSALVGRNPKVEGAMVGELPNIVRLDVGQGLSRTHASIRVQGWQVLIEDLDSANGTMVRLPGREMRRLHAREPMPLENGATIDFGGEITCEVELT